MDARVLHIASLIFSNFSYSGVFCVAAADDPAERHADQLSDVKLRLRAVHFCSTLFQLIFPLHLIYPSLPLSTLRYFVSACPFLYLSPIFML